MTPDMEAILMLLVLLWIVRLIRRG